MAVTGSLDGDSHIITGLTINRPGQDYVGLFGGVATGATVSGVGLVGGSVSGGNVAGGIAGINAGTITRSYTTATISTTNNYAGGLVGVNQGSIEQSYATGSVTGIAGIGGLVAQNTGLISQSYATGSVTGSATSSGIGVGGLVGINGGGQIEYAYATGNVTGGVMVGGLAGENSGSITQTYASGLVTGSSEVGGLVGYHTGSIAESYWDTDTTTQGAAVGTDAGSALGAQGLITFFARRAMGYGNFDLATMWYQSEDLRPILRSEAASADSGGVIAIRNLHQLQLMGANLAGNYRLTANIDASPTSGADAAWIFGSGGFVPVGTWSGLFSGSLDGAGYTISGLTINRSGQDYIGLFGASSGTLSRIGLTGGSVPGADYVGALVGSNSGTITQSYATGTMAGSVGGGTYGLTGGLVGYYTSAITQSYATGTVTGTTDAGGLVGQNRGTITQSYATGSVSGSDRVGGFAGRNTATTAQSYATGTATSVSGTPGGFVADNTGTLTSTFWNTTTSGLTDGVGSGSATGSTGLTTAQMQDLSNYTTNWASFDFTSVWVPPNQANQGGDSTAHYPELRSLTRAVLVMPTATTRHYGDANALLAAYDGVRAGDFITTLGTGTTTATTVSAVGSYGVDFSGAAATSQSGGYRYLYIPSTTSLTVTARPITLAADAKSRTYGDANPALTYSLISGTLVNGDALSGSLTTVATGTTGVGDYAITQGSVAVSANYTITYQGANLTVTANAQSRIYGIANPVFTYNVGGAGLVNGDALTGNLMTAADGASGVGDYAIDRGSLAASANYALTYEGALLTVTPALGSSAVLASTVVSSLEQAGGVFGQPSDVVFNGVPAQPLGGSQNAGGIETLLPDPRFADPVACVNSGAGGSCFAAPQP